MIGESVAIVVVLLVAGFMSLRRGRKDMAAMTAPFVCIPAFYLLGEAIFFTARRSPEFPLQTQRFAAVILGAVFGVVLSLLIARALSDQYKNLTRTYVPFATVFLAAMLIAYCIRLR